MTLKFHRLHLSDGDLDRHVIFCSSHESVTVWTAAKRKDRYAFTESPPRIPTVFGIIVTETPVLHQIEVARHIWNELVKCGWTQSLDSSTTVA